MSLKNNKRVQKGYHIFKHKDDDILIMNKYTIFKRTNMYTLSNFVH